MIPGGPLYVFSIGMGYTGEKFAKILNRKLQKLDENDRFFMNGPFRGVGWSKWCDIDVKRSD